MYKNEINISIKLTKSYEEDVIIYANCIGGFGIIELLPIIFFKPILKTYIANRLAKLPDNFISLHIRNTDRKSSYKEFIKEHYDKLHDRKIFVASDNYECIEYIQTIFTNKNVFSFSNIPKELKNKPIHENNSALNKEEFVLDLISDFFLLCFGKEYYYTCFESGYSKNIQILREKHLAMVYKKLK